MLTLQELRNVSLKEINRELVQAKKSYDQTRIQIGTQHSKNSAVLQKDKKYIAQILTVMRESKYLHKQG